MLLIFLGMPAPSSARTLYIGISANTESKKSPGEEQSRVSETGTNRLREDLDWAKVEPTNNTWDWSATDTLYQEAAERGMTILPVLNTPPCWAVPEGSEKCGKTYPTSSAEYAEFVAHVAERYGPGGDFWEAHPGLDGSLASKQLEIWNEPYFPQFTNGVVDPAIYTALYKAAVVAGRAANPATRYLVESTVEVWDTTTEEWVNWAAGMVKTEPAIGNYIDGIAIHPYPGPHDPYYEPKGGTDESFKNTDLIHKSWTELGINKPFWLTETGYSSCADEKLCVPGATQSEREAKKAEWLTDLFAELGESQYGYVHAVYLYNFRQTLPAGKPNKEQSEWYGIRDEEEQLPAWASFATAVEKYDGVPVSDTKIYDHGVVDASATFTFSTTDSSASLECQLDSGPWTGCTSPKSYSGLTIGSHTFQVRATNAEATESTPAGYEWSVTAPPLADMATTEPFDGSSASLERFANSWSALGWAEGSTPKGEDTSKGWRPTDLHPTLNGAYYNPILVDPGCGLAAVATMAAKPGGGRYFSLWLDMPTPSGTKAGYELRFTRDKNNEADTYTVTFSRWSGGTQAELASKTGYTFVNGNSLAIVDLGSTVAAWTDTGSGFTQLLSATDSSFAEGSAGFSGNHSSIRLTNFKAGALCLPKTATEPATGVKITQATLNGKVNPEGSATKYWFEYGTTESYGTKIPVSPESIGSGTEYVAVNQTASGLKEGTIYHFRVVAESEAKVLGEDKTFKTSPRYLIAFGKEGTGKGEFKHPADIAIDAAGNAWVVDMENDRLQKFDKEGKYITEFGKSGEGKCQLKRPKSVAIDAEGYIWVDDAGNFRIQKFNEYGECFLEFGEMGTGEGQFFDAESIAIDAKGNIWVADTYSGRLQEFDSKGKLLKVVDPPEGKPGHMWNVTGIDIGPSGNVWVSDWMVGAIIEFNAEGIFVQKLGTTGIFDGQFMHPDTIEVDEGGTIWVTDELSGRVQWFNEEGVYRGKLGSSGKGEEKFSFEYPAGIASDASGNLWIADSLNDRVQKWAR
jgi:sugar lactone lactonase YvrE